MSVAYTGIGWNRHKKIYDLVVVGSIAAFIGLFVLLNRLLFPTGQAADPVVTLIRALGTCAITLLHVILCIGPLARLDRRFLPLLYNRRHLGVATFLVALLHGVLVAGYYHGFGVTNPLVSLLVNTSRSGVPFELFGLAALAILFLMASTSHDFWLKNLSPVVWKSLHMLVYVAYLLLVLHVAFGALQAERSPILLALLAVGVLGVTSLHLAAGARELAIDAAAPSNASDDSGGTWIDVGPVDEIPENRARIVCARGGERIAVFRYGGRVSAVSNVCEHQNGPLGEGAIIDGCITCPWHGYQYLPANGQSPPPFNEKIATFRVRIDGGRVLVDPTPNPKGTPVEPARVPAATSSAVEGAS